MLHLFVSALLVCAEPSDKKLEPFLGVWETFREEKDGDKIHRARLVLEFKEDKLTFFTERDGKKETDFTLSVSVETERSVSGLVEANRLILGSGNKNYALYYEFVGERLILVGSLPNRPYEGYSLSGEFKRVQKAK